MFMCDTVCADLCRTSLVYFDRKHARAELKLSRIGNEIFISESNKTLHVHIIRARMSPIHSYNVLNTYDKILTRWMWFCFNQEKSSRWISCKDAGV